MGITQLDIIRRQTEAAVQNQVSNEIARIRRNTSLIAELNSLAARAAHTARQAAASASSPRGREPQPLDNPPPPAQPQSPARCADGYERISPVQPLYTPPDYWRKRIKKAAGIVLAVLLGLGVLWALLHYGILRI